MKWDNLVLSLVDAAATLYQHGRGLRLKAAVDAALDEYRSYYDEFDRSVLRGLMFQKLGQRGGRKAAALAKRRKCPRPPRQLSFIFSPPKNSRRGFCFP
jgi:hypothetical protein